MMRYAGPLPLIVGILVVFLIVPGYAATDHGNFIKGPFRSGPDVTRKCLECHETDAREIMKTTHWTWSAKQEVNGKIIDRGKKNTINNFCISVSGNWPRCTSCHIGYGWKDASFDFSDATKVDCLVCHDTTGTYKKNPKGAGMPKKGVDLVKVARSVGKPSRKNCGACHFYGGGGDRVKHGDLDSSLIDPGRDLDVHMSKDGAGMVCQDCHKTEDHQMKGTALVVTPGPKSHMDCIDCHTSKVHGESLLNKHAETVACQTCHIPTFAREFPTKVFWDWSTAGEDREPESDEYGMHTYHKKKGSFKWGKNIIPTYMWFNGTGGAYLLGDRIDPGEVTRLNWPNGDIRDRKARIHPFKVHRGRQIYDRKYKYLIAPKLFGKGGYWATYSWDSAARLGMKAVSLPYSGEYGFADTVMYWRINHMVAPADKALRCLDCHGDNGRLDWKALGYRGDPLRTGGRDRL